MPDAPRSNQCDLDLRRRELPTPPTQAKRAAEAALRRRSEVNKESSECDQIAEA